jgi:serpin B
MTMTSCTSRCSTAALLLVLTGCSGSSSPGSSDPGSSSPAIVQSKLDRTPASAVPMEALSDAVTANNSFAVDLYEHVLEDPSSARAGNLLTSPISASLALTMTYAGAREQTATEMAQALHLDASAGDAIFAGQNALSAALNGRGTEAFNEAKQGAGPSAPPSTDDYQLQVVNSVWGEKSYTWQPAFLDILAQDYGSGVYEEDFKNDYEPARLAINSWVSDQTNDKINDLLGMGSVDASTRMVLVNAIHLKMPWASPFQVSATAAAQFTRGDGSQVSVPFMNQTGNYGYIDDGQAQVVSIPLRGGSEAVMIALPHDNVTLADYEASLGVANAPVLSVLQTSAQVALSLPKMNFTSTSMSLTKSLQAMGMQQAFDPSSANLTGIAAPQQQETLYVSDVLQKTMISMQETGVEAAAATAVLVAGATSVELPPPTPVAMVVNRPYLVAIIDLPTQAVLMLGHVQDPSDAGSP